MCKNAQNKICKMRDRVETPVFRADLRKNEDRGRERWTEGKKTGGVKVKEAQRHFCVKRTLHFFLQITAPRNARFFFVKFCNFIDLLFKGLAIKDKKNCLL